MEELEEYDRQLKNEKQRERAWKREREREKDLRFL
jgi:hypothetical protein